MNRATMVTEVRQRLGEDIEDFWKDSHIIRMLDEAVRRFAQEERWYWLYTLKEGVAVASGARFITLEDDVAASRHFALTLVAADGTIVTPRRISPGDGARVRTLGRTGTPEFYYVTSTTGSVSQRVCLTPAADKAYTAEYHFLRNPVAMANDDAEPDIPAPYHEAIVAWATGMLWLKELNASSKASEQFTMYRDVLEQARADQKQLAVDDSVIWGQEDPLPYRLSKREFYERHLPQNL